MSEKKDKRDMSEKDTTKKNEDIELCKALSRTNNQIEQINESNFTFDLNASESQQKPHKKPKNNSSWRYIFLMSVIFVIAFLILSFNFFNRKESILPPVAEEQAPIQSTETTDSQKTIYIKEYDSSSGILTPQEIYSQSSPSVVSIKVSNSTSEGIGTGFVFDDKGYIATAQHVIKDMTEITVITNDKKEFSAKLISCDELTDLAVLKIEYDALSPLQFGRSSELLVGDELFAIGTPASLDFAGSMTSGTVSYTDRTVAIYNDTDGALKKKMTLLQTSTPLNPGNSGGPVFDRYGKVVGIVTMKLGNSFDGISFIIPSDGAYKILCDMRDGIELDDQGRSAIARYAAKMGIRGESTSTEEKLGVKILDFTSSECDAAKKLKLGDVIVSIDGSPIASISSFVSAIEQYSPGDTVLVTVLRSEQLLTFSIILTR